MTPLGFIIFPYLIKSLLEISIKKNFINFFYYGFFYGIGFLLVFLSWIYNPFLTFDETKNYAILSIFLPIFLSIIFGIGFSFLKFINKVFYLIIFTPLIFLFIEYTISNILYGFPWVSFSLILSNNLLGFYLLKTFGIYVSSYLTLFIFILPLTILYTPKYKYEKLLIFIVNIPFVLALIFLFIFNTDQKGQEKMVSLEIFQILTPLNNPNKQLIETQIIDKINSSDSEYLLFAENNYPYLISEINNIRILNHIRDNQKVIIGASRLDNNKLYNSFLFLQKNNIQIFDKKILVPFGEFLPFRKYLKFMETITGNFDFSSGNKQRIVNDNKINILPIICYEIIFNKIFKNLNKNNIDILINITNDSWFGNKIGPYQHFYHSRMRAIISNKFLIRISNNGISGIIDNNGKIIKSSKLNIKTSFNNLLQLKKSYYYKFIHNLFELYLIIIFLIYFIFIFYIFKYDK